MGMALREYVLLIGIRLCPFDGALEVGENPIISSSETFSNLDAPQKCWVIEVLSPSIKGLEAIPARNSLAGMASHCLFKNER